MSEVYSLIIIQRLIIGLQINQYKSLEYHYPRLMSEVYSLKIIHKLIIGQVQINITAKNTNSPDSLSILIFECLKCIHKIQTY